MIKILLALFSTLLATIAFAQKGTDVVAQIGTQKITLDYFNKKFITLRPHAIKGVTVLFPHLIISL